MHVSLPTRINNCLSFQNSVVRKGGVSLNPTVISNQLRLLNVIHPFLSDFFFRVSTEQQHLAFKGGPCCGH